MAWRNEVAKRPTGPGRAGEDRGLPVEPGASLWREQGPVLRRVWFRIEAWEVLAHALRAHGQRHEVKRTKETGFGPRYEVEGELEAPDGRQPRVRTVWQVDDGEIAPRLLTAYPLEANLL